MEKQQTNGSLKVICVYKDKKANLYTAPMLFDNEETALRHFDNMSNRDVNICDYDLYLIGHYSDLFGSIELLNYGEKYLLRSGDYYYDYVSKLKDFTLKINELKELYKEKNNQIMAFAKKCYKDTFADNPKLLTDEVFCNALELFVKEEYMQKGDHIDE